MTNQKPCLPECRTEMDMRRKEGERYITIHSQRCPLYGCSDPKFNPVDEANAPKPPEAPKFRPEEHGGFPAPAPEPKCYHCETCRKQCSPKTGQSICCNCKGVLDPEPKPKPEPGR